MEEFYEFFCTKEYQEFYNDYIENLCRPIEDNFFKNLDNIEKEK